MRTYISIDMEGIAGVVHESQTDPTNPAAAAEYGRFRRLMTSEANAAVEGAVAAGATRVLVNDSHWFMRNLVVEELHQVTAALKRRRRPFVLSSPVTIEVDFALTSHADVAELCPGATRTGGRTVTFMHADYHEVFQAWRAMLNLSGVV